MVQGGFGVELDGCQGQVGISAHVVCARSTGFLQPWCVGALHHPSSRVGWEGFQNGWRIHRSRIVYIILLYYVAASFLPRLFHPCFRVLIVESAGFFVCGVPLERATNGVGWRERTLAT